MGLEIGAAPHGSGLLALSAGLACFLSEQWVTSKVAAANGKIPVVGVVGWTQREQILNADPGGANRILILPGWGKYDERQHGVLAMPKTQHEGGARAIFTWQRKFTMSVWSWDATAPSGSDGEPAQIAASDSLVELALQGLVACRAGGGSVRVGSDIYQDKWSPNVSLGIELLVPLIHHEPLFGVAEDRITNVTPNVVSSQI